GSGDAGVYCGGRRDHRHAPGPARTDQLSSAVERVRVRVPVPGAKRPQAAGLVRVGRVVIPLAAIRSTVGVRGVLAGLAGRAAPGALDHARLGVPVECVLALGAGLPVAVLGPVTWPSAVEAGIHRKKSPSRVTV